MKEQSIRQYLQDPSAAHCSNFYDWFCRDTSLPRKQEMLDKKVRKLIVSTKLNMDTMYVWYKNNCPMNGSLYDDIRFSDMKTGDVIYTVVPKSGHINGKAEVWGRENKFQGPLVEGAWRDVLAFFEVQS